MKEGTHVTARVVEDWKGADCHLARGALVQGRIVQIGRRSKTEKGSSFEVEFDTAACNGMPFVKYDRTLSALSGPY